MKPVFTSEEMRGCDAAALNSYGVPGMVLMENASRGAAEYFLEVFKPAQRSTVAIVCGSGNNGGDGFAIARHLLNGGLTVRVWLLRSDDAYTGDARANLEILRSVDRETERLGLTRLDDVNAFAEILRSPHAFVIDAMLGTGLASALTGEYAAIVEIVNLSGIPVAAVDIPTGIHGDTGEVMGTAVRAVCTATMGGMKRGLLFGEGRMRAGEVRVIDIGMPKQGYYEQATRTFLIDESDIRHWFPHRAFNAHKYDVGSIFLLAGSTGFTGAATLASLAALRSGAGIVKLGIPATLNPILEEKLTEVMTVPLPETVYGSVNADGMDAILENFAAADAGVIGPGLSRVDETLALVLACITSVKTPLVIDADALFALAGHTDVLRATTVQHVLTPHAGEFARMIGRSREGVEHDRVECARSFAQEFGCTLVLKGAPTVVAWPNGTIFINPTGNEGMATAGSGDVLSGMIAALIGQGLDPTEAACCGVYLHGAAGDAVAADGGVHGMIASDLLNALPMVFRVFAQPGG